MPVYKTIDLPSFRGIQIRCDCGSIEHQIEFTYDLDDEEARWSSFLIEPHLTTYKNFFQRCWAAIKYVFGYRCKYGQWDCITLYREDVAKIKAFVEEFLKYAYKE